MGFAVVESALTLGINQLHAVVNAPVFTALGVAVNNGHVAGLGQLGNLPSRVTVLGLRPFGHGLRADVVAAQEHLGQYQQVHITDLQSPCFKALQIARHIQRQRWALVKGDAHWVLLVSPAGRLGRFRGTHLPAPGCRRECYHRSES